MRNARQSNPAPRMTTWRMPFASAAIRASSIQRVRAIPEERAPGMMMSASQGIARLSTGIDAMRKALRKPGVRKQAAYGSLNRRWRGGRCDSRARKNAMCSAVRLERFIAVLSWLEALSIINKTNISSQGYRAGENLLRSRKLRIMKDFLDGEETFALARSLILIDCSEP